jgi:tight adherence protein C
MPANIFAIVSTICTFGAFTAFVMWLLETVTATYQGGLAVHNSMDVSIESLLQRYPLANQVEQLTIALLPTVQKWRKEGRFGLDHHLEDWDRRLLRAGLRGGLSGEHLMGLSVLSAILFGFGVAIVFKMFGAGGGTALVFGFLPGAAAGFGVPRMMVNNVIADRLALIEKRLPFAIEFMLLAMEARAAFPSAIQIYCQQIAGDPLADEFQLALRDMSYGVSPQQALKALAARLDSDNLTAFVLAVNNGLDTGQPIKEVLKVQADATRLRRFESAERIAKTASTRAIFPLFMVAMAVLLLLVGPMAIRLSQESLF